MKSDKKAYIKLENTLKRAFREKEEVKPGEQWQRQVMTHIRSLGPVHAKIDYFALFGQFVWQCAPVASVIIVVLTLCIISLDFVPEYEIARLFVENPIEFSYVEIFGV